LSYPTWANSYNSIQFYPLYCGPKLGGAQFALDGPLVWQVPTLTVLRQKIKLFGFFAAIQFNMSYEF